MIMFFDTETTGKIVDFNVPLSKNTLDNFPRVTQLAYAIINEDGTHETYQTLIKPDGWEVPKEKFFIDNGMSTEKCEELGLPIKDVLKEFLYHLECCDLLVAHNMAFDHPVLGAEMIRCGLKLSKKIDKFCTMKSTIPIVKAKFAKGGNGYKYPTLQELHKFLFGVEFDKAHDALADVSATVRCYCELKIRELI